MLLDRIAHGNDVPVLCAISLQVVAVPVEVVQLAEASTLTAEAVVMCGAVVVMISPRTPAHKLAWVLKDADAAATIVPRRRRGSPGS